ncbi:MAG: T9SS type A sorting domain-containing protein [Flavobacteriales bacterium]|nr:T9SS type A sorting domain-containing protein [Flavobacteriales bacterium]
MENILKYKQQSGFFVPLSKSPFGGFRGLPIALQTNKKGSINARNLLDMAFHKKIKESYHFPQHNSNNTRLINNIVPATDNQQLINQQPATAYQLTNYPNPFNESTTIQAVLPENSINTYLVMHDLMGREIYRISLKSGVNKQVIDKNVLQPGIYLYAIEENGVVVSKQKLVKLK